MRTLLLTAAAAIGLAVAAPGDAAAFCGFFVAKADTKMFNNVSKVAITKADNRTVISMANDYRGDPAEFAIVFPTPVVLQETQINVAENALIDHLDAYTAPRLVEYFDGNPCEQAMLRARSGVMLSAAPEAAADRAAALGVTVEAEYTVGEYDIQILSAAQSGGLLTYLTENGYKLPAGAEDTLGGYIKQGMKFFLAKVNLEKLAERNAKFLRPIQIAFESDMFMLPIRLGMLNADGEQELFVFTLTRKGRVESTNYRTKPVPTGMDIPIFVKDEFADFYQSMFRRLAKEEPGASFMEYAWDMGWCDPCAADPLSPQELRQLGVWWVDAPEGRPLPPRRPVPTPLPGRPGVRPVPVPIQPQPVDVFVTRLHMRYTAETHPEDLFMRETENRENFQGRYVLRHPWKGDDQCEAAIAYRQSLVQRWEQESQTLANLTGWDITDIRAKQPKPQDLPPAKPWWERMWNNSKDGAK